VTRARTDVFEAALIRQRSERDPIEIMHQVAAAADQPAPTQLPGIRQALDTYQGTAGVVEALGGDVITTTADPDVWVAEALEDLQTAHAVDSLRRVLTRAADHSARHHLRTARSNGYETLGGPIRAQLARLALHAGRLPDLPRSIDPATNIATGTADVLNVVFDCLDRLGTFTGRLPDIGLIAPRGAGVNEVRYLAPFIYVPDIEPARAPSRHADEVNADPARDAVRAVIERGSGWRIDGRQAAQRGSLDAALVEIARGEHEPLRLDAAASHTETLTRARRMWTACMIEIHPTSSRSDR
jgi:hypothetical protein